MFRIPKALYQVPRSSVCWFQEEVFKEILPYMGIATILVVCPERFVQYFVLPSHKSSTCNLALVGQAAVQEEMFESINLSDLG